MVSGARYLHWQCHRKAEHRASTRSFFFPLGTRSCGQQKNMPRWMLKHLFSEKNKWDGSVWHTTYSYLFYLSSHSPVACNGGGYPFVDQHTKKRTSTYLQCAGQNAFFLTNGFSGNCNPFLDELKSSPQDSDHGQSLIYYCQKNITTNSMFT